MANIVSSVIAWQNPQPNGQLSVREVHTDLIGLTHPVDYIADAATNLQTLMAAHAVQIGNDLQTNEINANLAYAVTQTTVQGIVAGLTYNYSTVAELQAAGRALYQSATGWYAISLGNFFAILNLSNTQLTSIFGFTGSQLTTLKALFTSQQTTYNAVINAVGM